MLAETVDFLVPSGGREGVADLAAGVSGIVLRRFLVFVAAAELAGGFVPDAADRAVRVAVEAVEDLAVVLARGDAAFPLIATGFFSTEEEDPLRVVRLDVVVVGGTLVDGAREALFAAPETAGRLFSEAGLVGTFLVSSTELVDGLDLCTELVAVEVGRLTVGGTEGLVGGLFKELPVAVRFVVVVLAVELAAVECFVAAAVVDRGRFGGTVVFLGEATSS